MDCLGIERAWLDDYAWPIVNCNHLADCRENGGDPDPDGVIDAVHRDLRYPGYIGRYYSTGGLVLVGQIHNGRKLWSNGFRTVEAATWQWKCSNRQSDTGYLEAIRYGYEESLLNWAPWADLSAAICKIVGIDDERRAVRRVAFANVAKCWDIARRNNDVPLMKLCEAHYPMADLIGI